MSFYNKAIHLTNALHATLQKQIVDETLPAELRRIKPEDVEKLDNWNRIREDLLQFIRDEFTPDDPRTNLRDQCTELMNGMFDELREKVEVFEIDPTNEHYKALKSMGVGVSPVTVQVTLEKQERLKRIQDELLLLVQKCVE